jgi:hypothetical protein
MTKSDIIFAIATVAFSCIPWFYYPTVISAVVPTIIAICILKESDVGEVLFKCLLVLITIMWFPTPSQVLRPEHVPDGMTSFLGSPVIRRVIVGGKAWKVLHYILYGPDMYRKSSHPRPCSRVDWHVVVVRAIKIISCIVALYMIDSEYFSVIPTILLFV